jgi:hypothetical protein
MNAESTGHSDFAIGDSVYLRGAPFGVPGRILRQERGGKLAVLWPDLEPSYIGRHSPASLMLAGDSIGGPVVSPPINTELPATLAALLEQADEGGL